MKIYFAGSIRGGRENVEFYFQLINHLKKYGKVLTEHVGDKTIQLKGETNLNDKEIYNRDIKWISECDILIAEVSIPSLGVGFEIKTALDMKKKVLCLYNSQSFKKLSAIIAGCADIINVEYTSLEEAKRIIDTFFNNNNNS